MAEIGKDILKAAELLRAGELVSIPTETVYGLAGNALQVAAVSKIFLVKDRPHFDPLIVHVHSADQLDRWTISVPDKARHLARLFWPGPLTLLLPKQQVIPDLVTSGLDRVGIRCPDHTLTRALLHELDFPLAAPSANPFGYISPTLPEHVNEQLGKKIQYILDGGACTVGIESTIIGFEDDEVIIHRAGGLSLEKIQSVVGKTRINTITTSNPVSPGQLQSHYAPKKRLLLGDIELLLQDSRHERVGILSFNKFFEGVPVENQKVLSFSGDLDEAAQNLFSCLRALDKMDVTVILAESVPHEGIGRAINDRLKRAAAVE